MKLMREFVLVRGNYVIIEENRYVAPMVGSKKTVIFELLTVNIKPAQVKGQTYFSQGQF